MCSTGRSTSSEATSAPDDGELEIAHLKRQGACSVLRQVDQRLNGEERADENDEARNGDE